jgi:short-subunit dehydrogenase
MQAHSPDAVIVEGDLTDAALRRLVIARTIERYGRIDILLNNAGAGLYQPAHSAPEDLARRMFELNFFAALDMIQLVTPHMQRQRTGAIVNVSSIAGQVALPWFTLYSASKAALISLTNGLRMELSSDGIHCMAVCPGYVKTKFQTNVLAGSPPDLGGLSKKWAITAEKCADDIVRGLERNARTVVTPASGRFLIALYRLIPGLVERQLSGMYRKQLRELR